MSKRILFVVQQGGLLEPVRKTGKTSLAAVRLRRDCLGVLRRFADVERITARIALKSARPRDLSALRDSLALLPALREAIPAHGDLLSSLAQDLATPQDCLALLRQSTNDLVLNLAEGLPTHLSHIRWDRLADLMLDELVGIEEGPPQRRGQSFAEACFSAAAHADQDEVHNASSASPVGRGQCCSAPAV